MRKSHKRWSIAEELQALYIYLFGTDNIPYSIDEVAEQMERTSAAVRNRLSNIRYLDIKKGYSNAANQTKLVYRENKDKSELELLRLAFPELCKN